MTSLWSYCVVGPEQAQDLDSYYTISLVIVVRYTLTHVKVTYVYSYILFVRTLLFKQASVTKQ